MDMQKLLNKYWLDILVLLMVLIFVAIGCIYYLKPTSKTGETVKVTIEIIDQAQAELIKTEAEREKTVFINSINTPVSVVSVREDSDKLLVTVSGDGSVDEDGTTTFIGQRLLVGQKAEIHGGYFAQGKISKIEKAN